MRFDRLWKLMAALCVWIAERRSAKATLWRKRAQWFLERATSSGAQPGKD